MKTAIICENLNVRLVKMAVGIQSYTGQMPDVFTRRVANNCFLPWFPRLRWWQTLEQLRESLGQYQRYHVQLEGAMLPSALRDMITRGRMIVDVNDALWPLEQMRGACAAGDAVTLSAAGLADIIGVERYHLVRSACPVKFYSIAAQIQPSGPLVPMSIAYAGGVNGSEPWRDYRAVARACRSAGLTLFLYSGTTLHPALRAEYEALGAFVAGPWEYPAMLAALKRHPWVYVGSNGESMRGVVRNAWYDAMAAGCRVVSYNLREQDELIRSGVGNGVVLDSLDELSTLHSLEFSDGGTATTMEQELSSIMHK